MEKYLIINADDFGLSPSVNRGIIEAFEVGNISSTTMMANMPGFEDAVEHILKCPTLGVGMHFNLTYGSPINPPERVPSLVNEHGRFSYQLANDWEEVDIFIELHSQWDRFIRAGLTPTHIDSHQHIQMYLKVYKQLVSFANLNQLYMRKTPFDPIIGMHPLKSTDYFIMDIYFEGDGISRLECHLQNLKPGVTELMCHPGYVDDIVTTVSDWTDVREIECHVFTQSIIKEFINKYGIHLVNYKEIK